MCTSGGSNRWDAKTNQVEYTDLEASLLKCANAPGGHLQYARGHHCATILPDRNMLATGGSQRPGSNNVAHRNPVHEA